MCASVVLYEAERPPPSQTEGLTVKKWINFTPTNNKCGVHECEFPLDSLCPSFVSCRVTKKSQAGTFPDFLAAVWYIFFPNSLIKVCVVLSCLFPKLEIAHLALCLHFFKATLLGLHLVGLFRRDDRMVGSR